MLVVGVDVHVTNRILEATHCLLSVVILMNLESNSESTVYQSEPTGPSDDLDLL